MQTFLEANASDPCGGDALHVLEVYLTRMSTQSGPALKGFLIIKKKKKKHSTLSMNITT